MEMSKAKFLQNFAQDYGYPNARKNIDQIRATEFKRLEGLVYLDHAGATLYSETQMESVISDLNSSVLGNPHSQSESSVASSDIMSAARRQVLQYMNASLEEYKCIFTSGATAALKLIGECFPWSNESCFMYTMENHNSVLGIREYALNQGSTAVVVDIEENGYCTDQNKANLPSIDIVKQSVIKRSKTKSDELIGIDPDGNVENLFAFPSECNFSGVKYPLDLVGAVKGGGTIIEGLSQFSRGRWFVLIDAAKGCATEPPNLSRYPADFVVLSFYKIFGYPTGLGALVVRNEAAKILNKKYFSGGTVSASIADVDLVKQRENIEQLLEDGTVSFLSIASICHGFKIIDTVTVSAISRHTRSLATYVRHVMVSLKHDNGADVCTLYGRDISKAEDMGPTVAFNLKRSDGTWFGYREVEKVASLSGIHLRTGCFCNPGACAKYLCLSHSDLLSNIEAGHVCWDDNDIINGKPTGAVRISFGYMSTFEDAETFLKFVITSFVEKPTLPKVLYPSKLGTKISYGGQWTGGISLKSITVYPIKSCSGFSIESWPLSNTGLLYDREWLLKDSSGQILTQKKVPAMCYILTSIDLEKEVMSIESSLSKSKLHISLQRDSACNSNEELDVYGQRYEVQNYNSEVNTWFSEVIGRSCTFVRCMNSKNSHCLTEGINIAGICRETRSKIKFANEAQLLLISEGSVDDLNSRLPYNQKEISGCEQHALIDATRFRPNLVVSGAKPFAEDNWKSLNIGKAHFTSLGGCSRCQMVNIDQHSGRLLEAKEPLRTLASYRRVQGRILFGILLRYENSAIAEDDKELGDNKWLRVGQEILPCIE